MNERRGLRISAPRSAKSKDTCGKIYFDLPVNCLCREGEAGVLTSFRVIISEGCRESAEQKIGCYDFSI